MNTSVSIPARLAHLRELHTSTSGDQARGRDPICQECGHAWPCPVAEVFELVGAEVAHLVNPVIGRLRRINADSPDDRFDGAIERLRSTVDTFRTQ